MGINRKIVVIGSGNLATHLAVALYRSGANITQIYSPTAQHAATLAALVEAEAVTAIASIRPDADCYIISVKDDAIPVVIEGMGHIGPNSVMIHTAGSVPLSVFNGTAAHYAVLYPMQTFTKGRKLDFTSIPCFIEGSDTFAMNEVRNIADSISHNVVPADSDSRRKLHLAAVFACNMVNHCYRLAERVLEGENIDFKLFAPLIEETADKIKELTPREAQTGPMVRGDMTVMNAQMRLLKDDTMRRIYQLMAESIYHDSNRTL